ncbi:sperm acrosome-associated protein 9-like [Acanthaster planci]|uniref:Sperm acrosome-associated protein 9-like n=1 Tax=Acanthaster planci TaxID=133434 RepID=A0A8B7ZVI7_ACAPL|nr:sperm acrosome-associated protein 9-like [Acanthaster planci]XP_022108790.1 sperm acrosome-associated protein 9-like [Acanthaster planci]
MDGLKNDVARLRERYKTLQQQQFTFVAALEHSRSDAFERTKPVRTITQVKQMYDRSKNATDRRAMRQWLDLLNDLGNILRSMENVAGSSAKEGSIGLALDRWKVLLSPNHDLSDLRAKYPHQEVNHLSCAEARVLFGGVVSLVPLIFDQAHRALSDMAKRAKEYAPPRPVGAGETRANREILKDTYPPRRAVQSAKHHRSHTDSEVPVRAKTAMGPRDKSVDTKDLSKRMLRLSFGKMPKSTDEPVLFYRRTLNGRADKLYVNGEITLDHAPWRGASYDKINHKEHRRFVNLEGKLY